MSENPALQSALMDVPVQVDIVLGEARMSLEELAHLGEGAIVALGKSVSETVDVYVSDRLMARGKLVIADGELGITITEIINQRDAA